MVKRIALFGLMAAACAVPALAANGLQSSVANIQTADTAVIGAAGFRIWSLADATGFNLGTSTAGNCTCPGPSQACMCNANLGGGNFSPSGYRGPQDNTIAYGDPPTPATYYVLTDAQVAAGSCCHAAFYSIVGAIFDSFGTADLADDRTVGCAGAGGTCCFIRADASNSRNFPILNVACSPGGSHQLSSLGGLSAVSPVKIDSSAGNPCGAGQANLTWVEAVVNSLKNGAPNPYRGAAIYRASVASCGVCPGGDIALWTLVGAFPAGDGSANHCVALPATGADYYALRYRWNGPGGTTELLSGIGAGGSQFVGSNSQCLPAAATVVRVASMNARYIGRNMVSVNWTSGIESGLDGFYVTRSTSATGPFTRISDKITLRGDGSNYIYADRINRGQDSVLYYAIEIVGVDGTTSNAGPAAVTLPTPTRKNTQ